MTHLLARWREGDREALERLAPIVYDELRRLAASYLGRERAGHTLQPTALVNEAFIRLIGQTTIDWQNRAQFIGVAAQMMRRILVDHARARQAAKRGGEHARVELNDAMIEAGREEEIVAIDEALRELAALDERQAKVVELRFFGGLTIDETAGLLALSPATVKREWAMARAWLHRRIS